MSFLYRDHRGGLAESMETVQEFDSKQALLNYLRKGLGQYAHFVNDVIIEWYCTDERIGWESYIVHSEGYGVFGFTNGPVE